MSDKPNYALESIATALELSSSIIKDLADRVIKLEGEVYGNKQRNYADETGIKPGDSDKEYPKPKPDSKAMELN